MVEQRGEKRHYMSQTKWLLAHGSRDQLVPKRVFVRYKDKMEGWEEERVEAKLYEGMGHATVGAEVKDLCRWLEGVVPDVKA